MRWAGKIFQCPLLPATLRVAPLPVGRLGNEGGRRFCGLREDPQSPKMGRT